MDEGSGTLDLLLKKPELIGKEVRDICVSRISYLHVLFWPKLRKGKQAGSPKLSCFSLSGTVSSSVSPTVLPVSMLASSSSLS